MALRSYSRWKTPQFGNCSSHRTLAFEPLEERRLLAVATVTTLDDTVDLNDGVTSLREAIFAANTVSGADTIEFAPSLTASGPSTILLTQGELAITEALTIDGPGAELLTIDASGNDPTPMQGNGDGSRVFNIDNGKALLADVDIRGLTLTGGDSSPSGGAILCFERLVIADGVVTRNSTLGSDGNIGGGGAIRILNGELTVLRSTISNNWTKEFGGGINESNSIVRIESSAIFENRAIKEGGGILSLVGGLEVSSTTISRNHADGRGGAISVLENVAPLTISSSTIVGNTISVSGSPTNAAAGIQFHFVSPSVAVLDYTILARNTQANGADANVGGKLGMRYSLLGSDSGATVIDNGGNIVGTAAAPVDPLVGPLAHNGGPTKTHALLPGSPAIDTGDPAAVAGMGDVPEFDQRGTPWSRVAGGRIDMGAVESQANPLAGDYNFNGVVDAADYSVWRDTFGVANDLRADGSGAVVGVPDGVVDALDYEFWKSQFGNVFGGGGGAAEEPITRVTSAVASQPPALPGVALDAQRAMISADWSEIQAKPQADPEAGYPAGAAGRIVARESSRSDALIHWLASRENRTADDDEVDHSLPDDESAESGDLCTAFDCVFDLLGGDGGARPGRRFHHVFARF